MFYAIDFKGHKNLLAQEIPSAVGMRGFYIHDLGGDYDFRDFEYRIAKGEAREVSFVGRRLDAIVKNGAFQSAAA
jgi:hypothetical protein